MKLNLFWLIFWLFFLSRPTFSQEANYVVAGLVGTVTFKTGTVIKVGDRLRMADFNAIADMAITDILYLKNTKDNTTYWYRFSPLTNQQKLEPYTGSFKFKERDGPTSGTYSFAAPGSWPSYPAHSEAKPAPPGTLVNKSVSDYQVVKVKGAVSRVKSGIFSELNPGIWISRYDTLNFPAVDDRLWLLNTNRESFVVFKDQNARKFRLSNGLQPVSAGLQPATYSVTLKGRSIQTSELAQFFDDNPSILLLNGKFSIYFNPAESTLHPGDYFYIEFYSGGILTSRMLTLEPNAISFFEDQLFNVHDPALADGSEARLVNLYYYSKKYNHAVFINSLDLVRVDEARLTQEALVLFNAHKSDSGASETAKTTIENFIETLYGHPDPVQFDYWYQNLLFMASQK
ncbi:MAG: hypothetical protein R3D58_22330 [Saprospiraceae bacterium]